MAQDFVISNQKILPIRSGNSIQSITYILAASLVMAGAAQLAIYLPGSLVPVTGQTLALLFICFLLGRRKAFAAIALYLLEGGMGLPFFAGGRSGALVLLGPTGGYLVGFLLSAFILGAMFEKNRSLLAQLSAILISYAVILGVAWFGFPIS